MKFIIQGMSICVWCEKHTFVERLGMLASGKQMPLNPVSHDEPFAQNVLRKHGIGIATGLSNVCHTNGKSTS